MLELLDSFLIALSLAMDAFTVSISAGLTVRGFNFRQALRLGVCFGGFQLAMPLLGWLLGSAVQAYAVAYSAWLSFALLAAIGGKMLWNALTGGGRETVPETLPVGRLLLLAVATSMDALAVGVSYALAGRAVLPCAVVIGVVTCLLSVAGGLLGGRLGSRFQTQAQAGGGLVLLFMGVKILLEGL